MKMLELDHENTFTERIITIMIFLEGTILGPGRVINYFSHAKYIPIGNCVAKINRWSSEGAGIVYMTYVKKKSSAEAARNILVKNGFPGQYLCHRTRGEKI